MKVTDLHTKTVIFERFFCDCCKEEILNQESYIWTDFTEENEEFELVTVQYILDVCKKCFMEKIKPKIEELGILFRKELY